jgi:hypothetical protein
VAKTICAHCGYKNKGTVSVCTSCGYYLLDSQLGVTAASSSTNRYTAKAETSSYVPASVAGGYQPVIQVKTKKGIYKWLPTLVSFGPFVAFILLEYFVSLPAIYFIPFLFAIMFLSPIARRKVAGIRFFARGFSVRNNGADETYYYENIEGVQANADLPGKQSLTMSFKGGGNRVTMEFDSLSTFRMIMMQFKRRRIPITAGNADSMK